MNNHHDTTIPVDDGYAVVGRALHKWTALDWFRAALYGFMLLVAMVMLPMAIRSRWCTDIFDFLWATAKVLALGENPYIYGQQHGLYLGQHVYGTYPPSCIVLLLPWTIFPLQLAGKAWVVSNLLFIVMGLYFIRRTWFSDNVRRQFGFWLIALTLLSMGSTHVLIGNGQHLLFSLAFFFAGYYYATRANCRGLWTDLLSGVLLAISLFKWTSIAPLLIVFVFMRKFAPLVVVAFIHLILTIGVCLWLDCSLLTLMMQAFSGAQCMLGDGSGDIASILRRCGVANYGSYAIYGYIFFAFLFLLVAFTGKRDPLLKLSIFAIGSNFMFYHRGYDLVVWIIPIIYATLLVGKRDILSRLIIAITFLAVAFNCYVPVRLAKAVCPWLLAPYLSLGLQYLWFVILLAANWSDREYLPLRKVDACA